MTNEDNTQHFDSSILKADADGNGPFLSSELQEGEKLWADHLADEGVTGNQKDDEAADITPDNIDAQSGSNPDETDSETPDNPDEENGQEGDGVPAKSALKPEWEEYAQTQGYDPAEGLTKDQLIERYGENAAE